MITFTLIAVFGLFMLLGGLIFGHDHDHDFSHDHDFGHDVDHDVGTGEPTVSIFSVKVLGTFIMVFGAAGAIARYSEQGVLVSSLWGAGSGVVIAAVMYGLLTLLYSQQATTTVRAQSLVGSLGTVTVSIGDNEAGEVGIQSGSQYVQYTAVSEDGSQISKDQTVEVSKVVGEQLIVKKA